MTTPLSTTGLGRAQDAIRAAMADLSAVPDAALEATWQWDGHGEVDVRYGFFRILEDLEAAEGEIDGLTLPRARAKAIVAPATTAAWDLVGVLTPLNEDDLDADPGAGEWTVRQTVAHVIASQRSYGIYTAWWRGQAIAADDPGLPFAPEDLDDPDSEATAADGTLDEVRLRIPTVLDEAAVSLADLRDEELSLAARWSGLPVTIGFRQGRWSSHIAEHTIQVDKTLAMLDRQPSEAERLIRRLAVAWGRVEARIWPGSPDPSAMAIASAAATRAADTATSVRRSADA